MSKPVKWTLLVLLLALLAGVGVRFGVTRQRERAYQNALHEAIHNKEEVVKGVVKIR